MRLIRKGAEAELYSGFWHDLKVVKKIRKAKSYRIAHLDFAIRHSRTRREAQMIHDAKRAGVQTPFIYMVSIEATIILMQYIEGPRLREVLDTFDPSVRRSLCKHIGLLIGRLHNYGIIHGDLTTSNMIFIGNNNVFFIDFGLAEYSKELEKRGVDLFLMRRSLYATHYLCAKDCFYAIVEGYTYEMGRSIADDVLERVNEITKRGRYAIER